VSDADRWAIVERIYHEAVERPVADRAAFLESACAGDATLRRELESLLANDGASLLDRSALDVAAREMTQHDTPSWVGRTIRNYEILAPLGAGGMGEVYRARDTSLGRDVALKLLPRELSSDPERVRRLEREARILASLNHTRIATLYGLEAHDGQRFLVMELVPGQTLAERLRHGPLPIRDALDVCRQIAEGLEAAHEAGIVHRDLKPANIKVTPDGRVKLLDFGLAKALDSAPSGVEPTVAAVEATREGTVLGTPAYMSPEQARGQLVDRRADIWAFGCCLYECLSGRSAFRGNTVTDTLAAVLNSDPDWDAVSGGVPLAARRLLRRALAKDVRQRLQHIGDARLELEETEPRANDSSAGARRSSQNMLAVALGALLLVLVAAILVFWPRGGQTNATARPPVSRLTLKIENAAMGDLELPVHRFFVPFAISPDGERIVFHARGRNGSQLFLRDLSGFDAKPLSGTEAATSPFFSPDGRWVGFWRAEDRILRRVSITGGAPLKIAPTDAPHIALWGSDGEIIIDTAARKRSLWSIPAGGGTPQEIHVRDRSSSEWWIWARALVPHGSDLLVASSGPAGTWLDVLSRQTGTRRRLVRAGSNVLAQYTRTGHIVYVDGDALFALPVDKQLVPVGPATPVLHGIDHALHSNVALSDNGTVVYVPAERVRDSELEWLDRQGKSTPVAGTRAPFSSVSLSPDGRAAAGTMFDGTKPQIWIFDLERGTKHLFMDGNGRDAIWSRDGTFITYRADRGDDVALCQKRADGTGSENCPIGRREYPIPEDWSPDGRSLLFSEYTSRGDLDLWIYANGKTTPLIATPFSESSATFSPDGRFIAFEADDGGTVQVYVQPYPGPGPRTTISNGEGSQPLWAADGRALYYWSFKRLMVVRVQTASGLRVGQPKILFETRYPGAPVGAAPDGRFLRFSRRAMVGPPELRVVLNWFEELERLAPHPH
jgi:serine/threonine protein kinase/Tol biopolymer transport system component